MILYLVYSLAEYFLYGEIDYIFLAVAGPQSNKNSNPSLEILLSLLVTKPSISIDYRYLFRKFF